MIEDGIATMITGITMGVALTVLTGLVTWAIAAAVRLVIKILR